MVDRLSFRGLAAALLPTRYSAKYLENLATDCDTLSLPGDSRAHSLQSFHIPLRLREMAGNGNAAPTAVDAGALDIWDALFRSPRLAIVAEAGGGKTITLKYVAVALARQEMPESYIRRLTFLHQGQALDRLLPIYADVSQLQPNTDDLITFLAKVFAAYGFPGAQNFLRARCREGACLLLLDGLDALRTSEGHVHLEEFLAAYPRLQVVIATRTMHGLGALPGFTCFQSLPFSERDIATFVDRRVGQDSPAATALLQALERNHGLGSVAGNPFLLATLTGVSAGAQTSPLYLPDLYEQCLQILLGDGMDPAWTAAQPGLDREVRDQALQELGLYFHEQRQEQFDEEELQAAVHKVVERLNHVDTEHSLLAWLKGSRILRRLQFGRPETERNRGPYSFLRLAFQEYLAARVIAATNCLDEIVSRHVNDPWWHEVIVLATALQRDAADVVQRILASGGKPGEALFLAARCAIEAPETPPAIKQRLRDELLHILLAADAHPVSGQPEWGWHAAVYIAALEGQRVRDYFPRILKEGSISERQQAALVIGRVGAPEWATAPLLGALDGTRPGQVRSRAAWALGQLRDTRAIPALIAALKDEQAEVANEAALALSAIGEPAVPALIAALSHNQQARQMAMKSLSSMGHLALRPLLNIVQDEKQPDPVVKGAAETLGLLGDAQAIPYLIPLLRARDGKVAESAVRALVDIGEPAVQPLIDSLPVKSAELELRETIVGALVAIGEPSIEPLIQALNSSSTPVRNAAEEALTRIAAPAIDALIAALRTENWDLRRRIAQILGRIGDERLAEPLMAALNDEDPGVRARAAQVLGQIGHERAVEPLVDAMQYDPDEFVRRTAIKALADLRDERTVGPLIQALANPQLCDTGVVALSEIGEPAVEPLILAMNSSRSLELQQVYVRALGLIGARSRVEEQTLAAVAKAYFLLCTEQLSLDETIALLERIRWWKHGEELYQAFFSAQVLLQARSLNDVAECPEKLAWLSSIERPFRPAIKSVLWDLNNVAQSIRLYLSDPRREGQRDALLSAIDTLTEAQRIIDSQSLEFEKKPFAEIVASWHPLTEEAIKNLRGRAQLQIELLTDDLALDSTASAAKIVFALTNVGDSAARNLNVTVGQSGAVFEVVGSVTQHLEPLGSGMQRNVEFLVKPLDVTEATVAFEASYDDDEGTDHHCPFSGRVRFFTVSEKYRPIPGSPYVTGPPVKTPHMFYGRQDVFDWIRENISGTHQQNILVLHGERRMGKTSILYQLYNRPPTPQHICVLFSLELASTRSLGDLLYDMAVKIRSEMIRFGLSLPSPVKESFRDDARRSFLNFWENAESILGDRRLLVMIDEIDVLLAKVRVGMLSDDTFHFVRGLMQHSDKISFIFTGAYALREMLKDNESILFNIARPYKISYLNPNEAEALIVEPVAAYLTYDGLVVNKILRVTASHPYFIQCICDPLVKLAQRKQRNFVVLPDLDVVLHEVIRDNTGNLQRAVYAPLSVPEQKVLAALANVTDDYRVFVPPEMVAQVLDQYKLDLAKPELLDALHALRERDLVVEQRVGQGLQHGFKMDLIRMWLRQNEVLLRLSQEMKI